MALGVAASITVVVAVDLLVYFGSALSEPLFVVLVVGALASLAAAIEKQARWGWVAAAVLTAAACLTRYVGVALVVAEVAVLLMVGGRKAVGRAAAFAAASVAPLVVWLAAGRSGEPARRRPPLRRRLLARRRPQPVPLGAAALRPVAGADPGGGRRGRCAGVRRGRRGSAGLRPAGPWSAARTGRLATPTRQRRARNLPDRRLGPAPSGLRRRLPGRAGRRPGVPG